MLSRLPSQVCPACRPEVFAGPMPMPMPDDSDSAMWLSPGDACHDDPTGGWGDWESQAELAQRETAVQADLAQQRQPRSRNDTDKGGPSSSFFNTKHNTRI